MDKDRWDCRTCGTSVRSEGLPDGWFRIMTTGAAGGRTAPTIGCACSMICLYCAVARAFGVSATDARDWAEDRLAALAARATGEPVPGTWGGLAMTERADRRRPRRDVQGS